MNKLWLIIKREYLSRVTTKAFILGTFLTPLGIGALIYFNVKLASYKDDNFQNIEGAKRVGLQTILHEIGAEIVDVMAEF